MSVRLDPPRQLGITGSKSDYLIGYLAGLVRQLTFALGESEKRIEALEKKISALEAENAATDTSTEEEGENAI